MDKLQKLLGKCKCGFHLTVNQHRDYYQTAEEALKEKEGYECPPEIEPEVRQAMIDKNIIVDLQVYPDTPIGSYNIYHYDLEAAIDEALECLDS